MRHIFNALSILAVLTQVRTSFGLRGLREEVSSRVSTPTDAGIVIRATSKMISAFSPLVSAALKKQIPHMELGDIVSPFLHGNVNISKLRMTRFKAQDRFDCYLQEKPSQRLKVVLSGIDLDINGHLHVGSRLIQLQSSIDVWTKNVSAQLDIEFLKSNDSRIAVSVPDCVATIGKTDFRIRDAGRYTPFIPLFRKRIISDVSAGVTGRICQQVIIGYALLSLSPSSRAISRGKAKTMVEENLNKFFDSLPILYPLSGDQNSTKAAKNDVGSALGGLLNFPGMKLTAKEREELLSQLYLNVSLVAKPEVTSGYIESMHSGEIIYANGGQSGIRPPKLNLPADGGDRMLYIYITDYLFNSLLLLMYRSNLVYLSFDPNTVDGFKDLLKVPCDASFCLGAAVPEFSKLYPKHKALVIYQPNRAPAVTMSTNGMQLLSDGIFALYAKFNRKMHRLFVLLVTLKVHVDLFIRDGKIHGNATINNFDTRLLKHKTRTDEDLLDILSGFTKMILQHYLNSMLANGFAVPEFGGLKLIQPQLRMISDAVVIETDTKMNDALLRSLMGMTASSNRRRFRVS
ncbi:LBP BPI CETP C and LBP BPI CETP domain containing protein [Trichuris trichiura]|uniref:LBP BPI CETP C and LBP BPI CETP domain containing protein n=1 Tax=Trichuris trichiura TaxID=36087 RepID=A0A077Z5F9_TRITR|nr:LBP BPI CETP C and LBP BPI CETP domain containing protein [Trichuris trichiura]